MGLDWVIRPVPDDEELDNHDYHWRFRGKRITLTSLPEHITREAYTDMTPWQMDEFGDTLLDELRQHSNKYSDDEAETITDAAEWLQYWANEDKSLYAYY